MPQLHAPALPSAAVTFLFTDIEGSTQMWEAHPHAMRVALARHDALLREVIASGGGRVFKTVGDAFCAAFASAHDAVATALRAQAVLAAEPWPAETRIKVRIAVHRGAVEGRDGDYFGPPVNHVARLLATAHGGQTLLSQAAHDAVEHVLPGDASLRDLGTHRLKDLARAERVYELRHTGLDVDFPPIRSLSTHPNNLPQQLTSFIGRSQEIADIGALLARHRLLTLTGAGGSGKTRLSLQVAAEALPRFPDGAWLVELAPVAGSSLVAPAIAAALGVVEVRGEIALEAAVRHLKDKTAVLLFDNCEHLIAACATAAAALLQQCAGVRILATSREVMGIAGEQRYRVPPLPTDESAQLFADRARLVRPEFEITDGNARAVASVCRTLDGIPLAIELAAARLDVLSVEEVDSRLDHRFALLTGGSHAALPRHRTLRALIDWSYELLDDREQRLLQCLSVFAGGFTLSAAEQVFADDPNVLDVLSSIARKSLVVREPTEARSRWTLLDTVREYALEKLVEGGGEEVARDRHRDCYVALAERASEHLSGTHQATWLDELAQDHENFRAALEWSLARDGGGIALRLCAALHPYWATRGYFSEGRESCARVLGHPARAARTRERAKALNVAGVLAYYQADYAAARAAFEEGLSIHRELADADGIAGTSNNLANVAIEQGDYVTAKAMHEANLADGRAAGDDARVANALVNLGIVAVLEKDYAAARGLYEACLATRRRMGDRRGIAVVLNNLANVALERGDYAQSRALLEEGLAIRREFGDRRGIALALGNLAELTLVQGDLERARALALDSVLIAQEIGDERQIAHALSQLAGVLTAKERYPTAARILGFLEANGTAGDEDLVARARAGSDDLGAFDGAWREGRSLSLEQAIAIATGGGA